MAAQRIDPSTLRFDKVFLAQKDLVDNSLASQKQAGWVFYTSGGTWAWNMGSGSRRLTYERDNGEHMPLNDGRWHQLTMTYSSHLSEIRLFYDGENRVTYHVSDGEGFDFTSTNPLVLGWAEEGNESPPAILPGITAGAEQLQRYVDAFDDLGLEEVQADEFASLIGYRLENFGATESGGNGGGIQVLDVVEARSRTFEHLFVLGLNRGEFPRVVQEDPLLPDRWFAANRPIDLSYR